MKPAHDMTPTLGHGMAARHAEGAEALLWNAYDACWLTMPGIVRPLPISYAVRDDLGYQ